MRFILGAVVAIFGLAASAVEVQVTGEESADVASSPQTYDIDFAYAEHLTKYGLSYDSAEEFEMRKARYLEIDAMIRSHNSKEGVTFTMGHNLFSDWTTEERRTMMKGVGLQATGNTTSTATVEEKAPLLGSSNSNDSSTKIFSADSLPASVDWRTNGNVTAVHNQYEYQQTCYAGWAFAATDTISSAYSISEGTLWNLSAQQLLDCVEDASCRKGGQVNQAYSYYTNETTINLMDDYPYIGESYTCRNTSSVATPVSISSWNSVTILNGTQIKAALVEGPVGVTVNSSCDTFINYSGGIFIGNDSQNFPCSQNLYSGASDHSVMLVGYGTDSSTGLEYLIMKNSYGTDWGEDGYMNILYNPSGPGVMGVNIRPFIPTITESSNAMGMTSIATFFTGAILALALLT